MKSLRSAVFAAVFLLAPFFAFSQDVPSRGSLDDVSSLPQLSLEINAVQIVLNDEHREGVDWEAIVSDFHNVQLKMPDNPVWLDKKHRVSVGTLSREDYSVLLDALDTVGHMTQTPQPTIVLPPQIKQTVIALSDSKTGRLRVDATLVKTKGQSKLQLEPFIDAALRDNNGKPVTVALKGQTDIELQEDITIIIGGLTSEQEITKTHKFPILGDLPIVGLVFRNQGRLMQKTETIVFITPRMKTVERDEKGKS